MAGLTSQVASFVCGSAQFRMKMWCWVFEWSKYVSDALSVGGWACISITEGQARSKILHSILLLVQISTQHDLFPDLGHLVVQMWERISVKCVNIMLHSGVILRFTNVIPQICVDCEVCVPPKLINLSILISVYAEYRTKLMYPKWLRKAYFASFLIKSVNLCNACCGSTQMIVHGMLEWIDMVNRFWNVWCIKHVGLISYSSFVYTLRLYVKHDCMWNTNQKHLNTSTCIYQYVWLLYLCLNKCRCMRPAHTK